jgi:glycosyltransferase involved in cell wall biosynthesis
LRSLSKRSRWDNLGLIKRLIAELRATRPAILHCYLTEPSIVGLVAGRIAGVPAIIWGIRASNINYAHYDRINRITFRIAALLSRGADLMIANSDAGRRNALRTGFAPRHVVVVRNGIDVDCYRPSTEARNVARQRWRLDEGQVAIGVAARLDPMKGYETFLAAAAKLAARSPEARFICIGGGPERYAARLRALAGELGLAGRLTWMPEQSQMSAIYPGLDIVCSSSGFGEGFSNTVGEAMASAVPCVVTDVGDSSYIVGHSGYVVPPENVDALADALARMVALSSAARASLGAEARDRIVKCFGTEKMVDDTARAYSELGVL